MSPKPATARLGARSRPGITLTEILISILIMGVGLISLATLFPLGLVRLREAARQSRSGLLAESAIGDIGAKNLLAKSLFLESYYFQDPFLFDVSAIGVRTLDATLTNDPVTNDPILSWTGGGLPFCYDPLWRAVTDIRPILYNSPPLRTGPGAIAAATFPSSTLVAPAEARFGAGVVGGDRNLQADPAVAGGNVPSAHGLQRITNFVPYSAGLNWELTFNLAGATVPFTLRDVAVETFVSGDDIVMQNSEPNQTILQRPNVTETPGSIVPEFFTSASGTPEIRSDWRYTWFFTGRQVDATNNSVFEGDIVVCDSRPFGFDPVLFPPTGGTQSVAAGETTLEGIFGYGATLIDVGTNGYGYAAAADRTVLIRWPAGASDPEIKVGSWIADVTYERTQTTADLRAGLYLGAGARYPMQRCHWYQVARKGDIETETINGVDYRRLLVYTNSPLKSRTLLTVVGGVPTPAYLNAVLFMPSVVNVFPKTFTTR